MFGCRLRVCVAGGCRGPLFVLGPFVLAGDGLRGGAFVWVLFAWFFSFVGKIMVVLFFFGLVGSKGRTFYFWITARPRTVFGVWWLFVCFCQVFGPFIVF